MEMQNNVIDPVTVPEQPEPTPQPEQQEPEIALENGELKLSDSFFEGSGFYEQPDENAQNVQEQQVHELKSLEQQNYYTDDELNNTPYENWDLSKLPPEIRKYAQIVQAQMSKKTQQQEQQTLAQNQQDLINQRAQEQWQFYQQQIQAMQNTPATPPGLNEPKRLTPQELSEQAQKLARERLGLKPDDELEFAYDPTHLAAFNQALNELSVKNQNEVAKYQNVVNEYQGLQNFHRQMLAQPDFIEFDKWFAGKLRERDLTRQAVEERLAEYARQGGGFAGVRNVITSWYQEFQNEKNNAANVQNQTQNVQVTQQVQTQTPAQMKAKAPMPPKLESGTGIAHNAGKTIDFTKFRELDTYGQAKILEELGVV